ncbi:hypothetical protein [Photobacterium leiognathi]|uniref:STAND family AAA ATPase n=1 Tax=Photobacterium leiognathi TaxID=553611 RepID=UPI00076ADC01|nr:hypothetical protein [Photobacterium leiognathi]
MFIGDEQSGKSTFAKVIYKKALLEGFRPITIKGDSIKSANELDKYVEKAIIEQYKASDFFQSSKILLLIDGLTDSPLNTKFKKNFLKNVFLKYENVIIFSDSIVRLEDQIMNELSEFLTYEFQSMGAKKKDQLIDKWNLIGIDETCDDCDIQSRHDYLVRSVDSIMMRNIVPKKPIFVLMVLQILETSTPNDYSLTSYGHCYHSLILSAFSRANIRQDLYADYFNYLSELAYFFYKKNTERLNKDDLIEFKSYYSENYIVSSHDEIFDKLIKSKIIVSNFKEEYYFQYKYLLYFFVAKKITDAEQEELINQVDILCDKLHSEKHANILIFITHHTKSKDVITSIVSRVSKIFETYKPAKLDINEMKFLNKFANKISEYTAKVVIDNNKDIDEEREKKLEKEDKQEKEISLLANNEEDEDISFDEMNQDLLDVNRSYRALEILGQIIRNRKGSLHKKQLDQLGLEAYGVGLRFLKYYLNITQNLENEIIDEIHRLIETKRNWSKERIEKEAKFFYWTFSYMMSLNVVKKIGFCVGHKDLVSFYETISQKMNSEVADLIEIQIEIEFGKIIPKEKIEKLWKKMENNLITRRLLQEILVRHLHLNYVNHKDKQWISHTLSIPIKDQQRFQQDAINTRHQLNNISI